jgi:hypothetical protein
VAATTGFGLLVIVAILAAVCTSVVFFVTVLFGALPGMVTHAMPYAIGSLVVMVGSLMCIRLLAVRSVHRRESEHHAT